MPVKRPSAKALECLAQLQDADNLTPASVLKEAKDPNSPLHKYFEWDNTAAAEKWRLRQAFELIAAVREMDVITSNRKRPRQLDTSGVKSSRRLYLCPENKKPYKLRMQVVEDDNLRHKQVRKRLGILQSWVKESGGLRELQGMCSRIQDMLDRATRKLDQDSAKAA